MQCRFFIVTAILGLTLSSVCHSLEKDFSPEESETISPSGKGAIYMEWTKGDYYLLDSRSGRIWKLLGETEGKSPLKPVPYESSKGTAMLYPDEDAANQFPGRYVFTERDGKGFVLDTVTGKYWAMQENGKKPSKMILAPRNR